MSGVFYCTYKDFLTGNIPITAVLLVDEIDSLFFTHKKLENINDVLLSPLILLNKYKVIGMTATFRGDQGKANMQAFMHDSLVI
jgi:hypothetical protein